LWLEKKKETNGGIQISMKGGKKGEMATHVMKKEK
jgi:hypothetical protein